MIQRIQSFYLVLSFCAMVLCLMFPIATFNSESMASALYLFPHDSVMGQDGLPLVLGQEGYIHIWPLTVMAILCAAIALVSIFLYKNRMLQVRVVAFGFLFSVVYLFLIFFWAVDAYAKSISASLNCMADQIDVSYTVGTWAPIVAVVLFFLAQRAIKKDEAKVRAADRLR